MTRLNICLKVTFIFFNALFAIIGGVIIGFTLLAQVMISANESSAIDSQTTGLIVLYVVGASTVLIAFLGVYGAYKEHKVSLIVFLVCMILGTLLMIRVGTPLAVVRPQILSTVEEKFREFLPLNEASEDMKTAINSLQSQMHCCGLFDARDWGKDFPASCTCSPTVEENECMVVGSSLQYFMRNVENRKSIYRKPCLPVIEYYLSVGFDIVIGLFFGLAALAVLGMILSSVLIHQLRRPSRPVMMFTIPEVFTPDLPKYEKLQQAPPPPY